ncbi:MAG: PstS family phosphate ABC transporter substrate-binding protein [Bacillota bacterium]
MALEFVWQHLGLDDEDAYALYDFISSHRAYKNLVYKRPSGGSSNGYNTKQSAGFDSKHPVDLVIAPAPSTGVMKWAEDANVELISKPVAYDALVFITHKNNPIESLTIEEVQDIFSGKITNWQELGGDNTKIKAFQREEESEIQAAIKEQVMQDIPLIAPRMAKVKMASFNYIEEVAEYKNSKSSIGYTYRLYFDRFYAGQKIKMIPIAGVDPTDENIRSGSYPLSTTYNAVIRSEDQDKVGGKFMQWMLSDEGQACIKQAGYLPLR